MSRVTGTGGGRATCCQPDATRPVNAASASSVPSGRPQASDARPGPAGAAVVAQRGDEAVLVRPEAHADLDRPAVVGGHAGGRKEPKRVQGSDAIADGHGHAGGRRAEVAAVVGGAAEQRDRARRPRRPAVSPRLAAGGRVPAWRRRRPRPRRRRRGRRRRRSRCPDLTVGRWRDGRAVGRRGDRGGRRPSCRVEAVAAPRPACSVAGWTPMSASRLTVACCIGRPGPRCRGRGRRPAPTTTGRCRRRRPARPGRRRSCRGRASGGGSPCPTRRSSRSPAASRRRRRWSRTGARARPAARRCRGPRPTRSRSCRR